MLKKLFLLLIFSFILTGCATHIPLSKENQQNLKEVYIKADIKKPDGVYQFSSGGQFGLVGAAARLAIDSANGTKSATELTKINHIDISKIVYQAWNKELSQYSRFKISNKPTDTILETKIINYGISIPHGLSSNYVPVLIMQSKLIRNNQVIWQDRESILPLTRDTPQFEMDQIQKDPEILIYMWNKAAEKAIKLMVDDMWR